LRRRVGELERPLLAAACREQGEERGCGERAYHPGIMTETDFHRAVEAVLARIDSALDAHDDLDVSLEEGVLTVECPDASRIIVNRQTPNREIWVAARSGGFHYAHRDGEWRDTRTSEELFAALARLIEAQSDVQVAFN
jgi:CyaY protein